MQRLLGAFAAGLVAFVFAGPVFGDPAAEFTYPKLLSQPTFHFPASAQSEGQVTVEFDVLKNGTVSNPRVIGDFQVAMFQSEVLSVLQDLKFEPATYNGAPINFLNLTQTFVFEFPTPAAASQDFADLYDQVRKLVDKGDYDGADAILKDKMSGKLTRLYEYGLYTLETATVLAKREKYDAALLKLQPLTQHLSPRYRDMISTGTHLTGGEQTLFGVLPQKNFLDALGLEFFADTHVNRIGEALSVYETTSRLETLSSNDPFVQAAPKLKAALASKEPFYVAATLVAAELGPQVPSGIWVYTPARRTWAVQNVKGHLDHLQVSCEASNVVVPYAPDQQMTVPASWGKCTVTAVGDPGTTFIFAEANL